MCVCVTVNIVHLCAWQAPCVYFPEGCLGVACTLFVDLRTFFHPAETCVTVGTPVCSRGRGCGMCVFTRVHPVGSCLCVHGGANFLHAACALLTYLWALRIGRVGAGWLFPVHTGVP